MNLYCFKRLKPGDKVEASDEFISNYNNNPPKIQTIKKIRERRYNSIYARTIEGWWLSHCEIDKKL